METYVRTLLGEKMNKRNAFTLAEVLITLGIIGIVAALTLPTLINNQKEKTTISKLKKFQTTMNQALMFSKEANGTPDLWNLDAQNITDPILSNKFIPYLKILKNCGFEGECFYNKEIKFLNGNTWANLFKQTTSWKQETFILSDGSMVAMNVVSADCSSNRGITRDLQNVCALIYIDTNGEAQPNTFGKDFFSFYLTKYSVIPTGTAGEYDTNHSFSNNCISENANGMACTAWVIENENMDYLKCPTELSWNGKHTCK